MYVQTKHRPCTYVNAQISVCVFDFIESHLLFVEVVLLFFLYPVRVSGEKFEFTLLFSWKGMSCVFILWSYLLMFWLCKGCIHKPSSLLSEGRRYHLGPRDCASDIRGTQHTFCQKIYSLQGSCLMIIFSSLKYVRCTQIACTFSYKNRNVVTKQNSF